MHTCIYVYVRVLRTSHIFMLIHYKQRAQIGIAFNILYTSTYVYKTDYYAISQLENHQTSYVIPQFL